MKKNEIKGPLNKLIDSIDNLLSDEKEQKLRSKLGKEVRKYIFTDEIVKKLNESDFSGLVEQEEEIEMLFSMIFPVFIEKDDVFFRLYKHKIEVDLSDEMSDRYIYIFSDGRLISGLFECFKLYDDEYIYGIKKIINIIPRLRETVKEELVNLDKSEKFNKQKIGDFKNREIVAKKNFNELIDSLNKF
ncbi:hypothetical protein KPL35_13775 [Clostridium sp. CF011]|uniref:hypothetical protein n=1 Tax=Clostridium sp. CF011 TaxID=2843318 RepID=UPI001C0D34F8|nr:hypothetical protein [Clostridium sp. CF011]MBU3093139.1 hypothetical protein [Clostridium sp. CF011]WAG68460.1 hypothetical protein LL036_10115 [Clostridium sp. CF011]